MEPFTTLTAVAAPLNEQNIDTDQIAPARFLRRPRADGYGRFLFHDLRFDAEGSELAEFVLNRPAFRAARILVADRNFGGGSSREQAVWALLDHGIRCVIAESFGDIFSANSVNQGLLLVRLPMEALLPLRNLLHGSPGIQITVDLATQQISVPGGTSARFDIEPSRKQRLLLGLDAIGMTMRQEPDIAAFAAAYRARRPWLFRTAGRPGERQHD